MMRAASSSSSWTESDGCLIRLAKRVESSKACKGIPGNIGGAMIRFGGKAGELVPISIGGGAYFGLMLGSGALTIISLPGMCTETGEELSTALAQVCIDSGEIFLDSVKRIGLTCASPIAYFGCGKDFVERHDKSALKSIEGFCHPTEILPNSAEVPLRKTIRDGIMHSSEARLLGWCSAGMPLVQKPHLHRMKPTESEATRDPVLGKAREWEEEGGCWSVAGVATKCFWKIVTLPKKACGAGVTAAKATVRFGCAIPFACAGGIARCFSKCVIKATAPRHCNTGCLNTMNALEDGSEACATVCCGIASCCCKSSKDNARTSCIATAGIVERVSCDPLSCIASCCCQTVCPKSCERSYTHCTERCGKTFFRRLGFLKPEDIPRPTPGHEEPLEYTLLRIDRDTPAHQWAQDMADPKTFYHRYHVHNTNRTGKSMGRGTFTEEQRKELKQAVQAQTPG